MPSCLKCGAALAVNEEGIAPVLCDRCAGAATSRARRTIRTGTMRDFPVTTALAALKKNSDELAALWSTSIVVCSQRSRFSSSTLLAAVSDGKREPAIVASPGGCVAIRSFPFVLGFYPIRSRFGPGVTSIAALRICPPFAFEARCAMARGGVLAP